MLAEEVLFDDDKCKICSSIVISNSTIDTTIIYCKNDCIKCTIIEISSYSVSYDIRIFYSYFTFSQRENQNGDIIGNVLRDRHLTAAKKTIEYWKENDRYLAKILSREK